MNKKEITVHDFLLQASKLPLGAQLYAAATEKDPKEGERIVTNLMREAGVAHEMITPVSAAAIHKAVRDFVQNSGFRFPGDLPKY